MKVISRKMRSEYGCLYCTEMVAEKYHIQSRYYCQYNSCPYNELQGFRSYEDYIRSKEVNYGMGI